MVVGKRVIYHNFTSKGSSKIVDNLCNQYRWEPILITGNVNDYMHLWIEDKHKDCILQSTIELRTAQFDYTKIGKPVPIDAELISALAKYELNYLDNIPDSTGWNYSFTERKRFYFDILRYWNTVIHNLKPDLFVNFGSPHTPTEHALYLLCKHYFKIDVLYVSPIPLFNRCYHYIGTSLEKIYEPFMAIYESNQAVELGDDLREYLSESRSKEVKAPQHILDDHKRFAKNELSNRFKLFLKSFISTYIRRLPGEVDWKKNTKEYDSSASRMNHFEYFLFLEKLRWNNNKLIGYYKRHCVQPDLSKKFIYFAAPFQPEANTVVNGGVYEDLLLVIDILSACIPEDWIIYYKEHPGTFLGGSRRRPSLKRNSRFYEKVDSYNNVFIVSSKIDSFEMMDNSQAVSSVSGSAVWESTVRGKPTLSFGSAWYHGCKSIFRINSLQDANDAIKKIVNGYVPDQDDVLRYIASIEKVSVKKMIYRDFEEKLSKVSNPAHELERISSAIYKAYQDNYM